MRIGFALVVVGVLGCTSSGPSSVDNSEPVSPPQPQVEPDPDPTDPKDPKDQVGDPVAPEITVQLTAATLADDCGGGPTMPPQAPAKDAAKLQRVKSDQAPSKSKGKRRCDQSSIQLAITASEGAEPAQLEIKSVLLLLESGRSLGNLVARNPSVRTRRATRRGINTSSRGRICR
jgi:hypothetical protein